MKDLPLGKGYPQNNIRRRIYFKDEISMKDLSREISTNDASFPGTYISSGKKTILKIKLNFTTAQGCVSVFPEKSIMTVLQNRQKSVSNN